MNEVYSCRMGLIEELKRAEPKLSMWCLTGVEALTSNYTVTCKTGFVPFCLTAGPTPFRLGKLLA